VFAAATEHWGAAAHPKRPFLYQRIITSAHQLSAGTDIVDAPLKGTRNRISEKCPCPSDPPLYILLAPDGITKPDCTFNEIIQGLLGDGKPFWAEVIAQKIKSSLGPAYQRLML